MSSLEQDVHLTLASEIKEPRKIISYCLYGDKPLYTHSMIENCLRRDEFYPDFEMWIYHDDTVPKNILDILGNFSFVKLKPFAAGSQGHLRNLSRFLPMFDWKNSIILVRDADSWINIREARAVREWMADDKSIFHIMRDSQWHLDKVMAGMFGIKITSEFNLTHLRDKYMAALEEKSNDYFVFDQTFLREIVYPLVVDKSTIHASANKYEEHAKSFQLDDYPSHIGARDGASLRATEIVRSYDGSIL